MPPSEIRKEAREALKGKWGKGVCITLAYIAFIIFLSIIQSMFIYNIPVYFVLYIAIAIISVPIALGLVISFIKLKRGEQVTAFGFFKYGFSRFGKSWGIAWHTFIRMLIPIICMFIIILVFSFITTFNASSTLIKAASSAANDYRKTLEQEELAIGAAQSALSGYLDYDTTNYEPIKPAVETEKSSNNYNFVSSPWFGLLFVVLYIAILVYTVSRSLLYVLAHNICYDNPELSSKECVVNSAKLMKGNRGNYFVLCLTFIGWAILAALPLYLGFFLLIPYMQVTIVCFYDRLVEKNNI